MELQNALWESFVGRTLPTLFTGIEGVTEMQKEWNSLEGKID